MASVLVAAAVAPSSALAFNYIIGYDTYLPTYTGSHGANYLLGQKVIVTEPSYLSAIGAVFLSSGQNANFGLYTNSTSGLPDQLVAQTGEFTIGSTGITEVPIPALPYLAPDEYWLMGVYDPTVGTGVALASGSSIYFTPYRSLSPIGTLPTTFGSATTYYRSTQDSYYIRVVPEPATALMLGTVMPLVVFRRFAKRGRR